MESLFARPFPRVRSCVPILVLIGLSPLMAKASYDTKNFAVEAPNADSAKRIGDHAEACRKSIATAWLGKEMPAWQVKCPIKVMLTAGEAGGETSFAFSGNRVADQRIRVEGRLDRILASSLPHEITHTIFAAYFGGPMPRWADEGASLLSEDLRETQRHDQIVASLLSRRGDYALGRLFVIEEYPADLMGFYGQGYSVSRFLIEMGGRPRFLQFVKDGMSTGWDAASKAHYALADCKELDRAWRSWHTVVAAKRPAETGTIALSAKSPTGR
jgi:hypothetical protein